MILRMAPLFALACSASLAAAQRADPIPEIAGPPIGPVVSQHSVQINGTPVQYRAVFREYELRSPEGRPRATISATAYLRGGSASAARRPVFFFFNGGPGASSSPLHYSAFGPRLRPADRNAPANTPFIPNEDSLLDVADLVFIDPVATGFSRVLPGGEGTPYWSPNGDAGAVLQLIRSWLTENERTQSPVFIAGESYGGFRLATMAKDFGDLNVVGLMLISPGLDLNGILGTGDPERGYALRLPSMAAAAWHHGRIERGNRTVEQFFEEARRFAETDYIVALHQGSALAATERRRIAQQISSFIGLPAEAVEASDIRVSADLFVESLLRDQNRVVGRLDSRVSAPVSPPARSDRPAAANDPSLGLGRTNVISSEAISHYLREELNVPVNRPYVSLSLDVNFNWNWSEASSDRALQANPIRNVASFMSERPNVRLLVVGGLYDIVTPVLGARYVVSHSGVPRDRATFLVLPAGHSPFEETANRRRFAEEVRTFVTENAR